MRITQPLSLIHILRLPGYSVECVDDSWILQIAFNINEKTVFPAPAGNRPGFNHPHVDMVENKIAQHIVEGTAFVGEFKADADLLRPLSVHRFS